MTTLNEGSIQSLKDSDGNIYENHMVASVNEHADTVLLAGKGGMTKLSLSEVSLLDESDDSVQDDTPTKSKRQLAEELYEDKPELTRKEAIPQLVELGLTESSASAYYHRIWNQSKTD